MMVLFDSFPDFVWSEPQFSLVIYTKISNKMMVRRISAVLWYSQNARLWQFLAMAWLQQQFYVPFLLAVFWRTVARQWHLSLIV